RCSGSAISSDWAIAGIVEDALVGRQRYRVVLIAAHERADAVSGLLQGFDVAVREVVQPPLVGLGAGKAAHHSIGYCPREAIRHPLIIAKKSQDGANRAADRTAIGVDALALNLGLGARAVRIPFLAWRLYRLDLSCCLEETGSRPALGNTPLRPIRMSDR